jgi:hypothetical protein
MKPLNRRWFAPLVWMLAGLLGWLIVDRGEAPLVAGQAPAATAGAAPTADQATITRYCASCHNQFLRTGGLALDTLDATDVGSHAEVWEKVVRKIRTGVMPPSGAPRPERGALDALAATIEDRLDRAAPPSPRPAPVLHRLNRTEYANAVRDLLALDVDVETLLPPDGSSEGFDNIADALGVSPALVQGYVTAAMKISRQAVGDRTLVPAQVVYSAPPDLVQDRHLDGMPLGTRGGMRIHHFFPLDAEYEFTIGGGGPGGGGPGGGGTWVSLDGERVTTPSPRSFRLSVPAGSHDIAVAVIDRQRGAGVDDIHSDFRVDGAFVPAGGISSVTITGPFDPTGTGDTPSRQRIFTCTPATAADERPCARDIFAGLARRAYRGVVREQDIETLLTFYDQGRAEGDFETGIQRGLARLLVSPQFVYRVEEAPADLAPGDAYRIDDLALASRLSFFLWSSIPDDELLDLAESGGLRAPEALAAQVRRMLEDPKVSALVENFAGQWLFLRDLDHVQPEAAAFDENLRRAFRRETELLVEAIVREDRSLVDLLDADWTFLNDRLARHYGVPDVRGSHFRRIALDAGHPRRGLLGHGSLLTVTSVATRTSPVMRGQWILEHLLGTPAPDPPPGVETNLEEEVDAPAPTSVRQRLEQHRANPVCASCHNVIDPLGFALENFDLVGAWREDDGGVPIDASGQLADGTPITGPGDLRRALLDRSDAFLTTATEKLLTYALGRAVHFDDMPAVRAILRRAAASDYRFSSLVLGVVESEQFQTGVKGT